MKHAKLILLLMAVAAMASCEPQMPEEKRLAWGHKSREIAETLFSKEAFVQKYIKLIENKG